MPASWSPTPATEDEDELDMDVQADLAECLGIDPAEFDANPPEAFSPDFITPTEAQVSARVSISESAEEASRRLAILTDERTPACLGDLFTTAIEGSVTTSGGPELQVGAVTVEQLDFPPMGDETAGYRVIVPISAEGEEVVVYLDLAFVRVGQIGISDLIMSQGTPFDTTETAQLTEIMVGRATSSG